MVVFVLLVYAKAIKLTHNLIKCDHFTFIIIIIIISVLWLKDALIQSIRVMNFIQYCNKTVNIIMIAIIYQNNKKHY